MPSPPSATDKIAPAPQQTAAVVMAMSALQNKAGRLNRLRALARTNRDVAWAMTQDWTAKPAKSEKPAKPSKKAG